MLDTKPVREKLVIEDAKLIFRNFAGQPTQFNPEGKRDFCVLLNTDLANELKLEGWNVRWLEGRVEGDEPQAYMNVSVSFDNYPPSVMAVTESNKTIMKAEELAMLDWAEIEHVDLIIRPYSWEVNNNKGVKAYLKSMYVKIEEDEFSKKYSEIPVSGGGNG